MNNAELPSPLSPQHDQQPSSTTVPPVNISDELVMVHIDTIVPFKLGCAFWEPFFEKQKQAHECRIQQETPVEQQRRESHEKNPPTVSAPMFVWDWDFNDPTKFVCE